jgi:hypothetical protein
MITKLLLGFVIKHDFKELQPVMESSGFSQIEISQAKYRILSKIILSYLNSFQLAGLLYLGAALAFCPFIMKNWRTKRKWTDGNF